MKCLILCICCFGLLQAGPKVVAKFGPPECPWSEKLKKEIWDASSFQALLCSAGIEREERESTSIEKELPLLTLVDESGEEIGSLGFLLISPEKYVDLFKEMISIHTLSHSSSKMPSQQLLNLYRRAHTLEMQQCEEKLMQKGLVCDQGVDFLIEYYAKIVKDHPRRAHKIKQEIRLKKPDDISTEWSLALLSFQAKKDNNMTHSDTVLPLEKFLKVYGKTDTEYAWRCHLVLAEYYQDTSQLDKARYHVKMASDGAPADLQMMIRAIGDGLS